MPDSLFLSLSFWLCGWMPLYLILSVFNFLCFCLSLFFCFCIIFFSSLICHTFLRLSLCLCLSLRLSSLRAFSLLLTLYTSVCRYIHVLYMLCCIRVYHLYQTHVSTMSFPDIQTTGCCISISLSLSLFVASSKKLFRLTYYASLISCFVWSKFVVFFVVVDCLFVCVSVCVIVFACVGSLNFKIINHQKKRPFAVILVHKPNSVTGRDIVEQK
jgi:hypothetical protein